MDKDRYKLIRKKHKGHRGSANQRGVKYLTFEQYVAKIEEAGIEPEQIGTSINSYHLCRNTDQGDYTPDSCRFATFKENIMDKRRNGGIDRAAKKLSIIHKGKQFCYSNPTPNIKPYRLKSPDGKVYEGHNIAKFCRENNLTNQKIHDVLKGKVPHHKGWRLP